MKKEIKATETVGLSTTTQVPLTQTGDKNTAVQHADSVTINNYIQAGTFQSTYVPVLESADIVALKGTDKLSRFLSEAVKCIKVLEAVVSREPYDVGKVMDALKSLVKAGRGLAADEEISIFRDELTAIYADLLRVFNGKNGIVKTTPEIKYLFEKRLYPVIVLFVAENDLISATASKPEPEDTKLLFDTDREYYNLIVTTEEIKNGRTSIEKKRVLTDDTSIVKQLTDFSEESRARLKNFPSLIMNENTKYAGNTDPDQMASFGFITDIKIQQIGLVRIKFRCVAEIPQKAINNIVDLLDILGGNGVMELNRTHWTIKNVDLIEELSEAGLLPKEAYMEVTSREIFR